jgi:hypothetical protein
VSIQRVRLAAWQEQVIAKANFVECESERLLSVRKGNQDIDTATKMRLADACRAAGVQRNGEPLQRRSWIVRLAYWPVNAWTGAPIKGAFVTPRRTSRRAARAYWPGCKPASPHRSTPPSGGEAVWYRGKQCVHQHDQLTSRS